jgi:hypothetical protein
MLRADLLVIVVMSAMILVTGGCGAGSSSSTQPPAVQPFSNATLNGQYAFTAGAVTNVTTSSGFYLIAGSLQADGNGHITTGTEDINEGSLGVFQNVSFSGTYSVGADGRGSATITSPNGTSTFRFIVASNSRARIIEFDNLAGLNGLLEKQDPTAFTDSALNGSYAFTVGGSGSSSGLQPFQVIGTFLADGAGTISSGTEDTNGFGVLYMLQPLSGTYTVGSNGRGTLTLSGSFGGVFSQLHFSVYVLSTTKIRMLSLDAGNGVNPFLVISGTAERQEAASFSASDLSGDYVFVEDGATTLTVGRFSADGLGGINSGVEDENGSNITPIENVAFSGAYSLGSNGRGTVTLTPSAGAPANYIFYAVSPDRAFAMGTDTVEAPIATVVRQQGGSLSTGTLTGNYAFDIGGGTLTGVNIDTVGQLLPNGNGNLGGTEDLHQGTTLFPGASLSGTYSVNGNGRGTATISSGGGTSNFVFYLAACSVSQPDCGSTGNSPTPLILGVDSGTLANGTAEKQF